MATEQMKQRAREFEIKTNREEKSMLRHRAKRVKAEGYKSESEYFAKTNPFRNTDNLKSKALNGLKKKIVSNLNK